MSEAEGLRDGDIGMFLCIAMKDNLLERFPSDDKPLLPAKVAKHEHFKNLCHAGAQHTTNQPANQSSNEIRTATISESSARQCTTLLPSSTAEIDTRRRTYNATDQEHTALVPMSRQPGRQDSKAHKQAITLRTRTIIHRRRNAKVPQR